MDLPVLSRIFYSLRSRNRRNNIDVMVNENSFWMSLPSELLVHIFSLLKTPQEIHLASLVCKQWYYIIWNYQEQFYLQHIKQSPLADCALKTVSSMCPRLYDLHVSGGTDSGFKNLEKLEMMKSLELERCGDITDISLEYIGKQEHLTNLTIAKCLNITDKGIQYLEHLPLKKLSLFGLKLLTDEGMKSVGKLEYLEELNLHGTLELSDSGLEELKNLKNIRKLNLSWCHRISGMGFKSLYNFQKLEVVHLRWNFRVSDETLYHLGKLQSLKELHLSGCEQITNKGIDNLSQLQYLKYLDLGETRVDNLSLKSISQSQYVNELETLIIRHNLLLTDDGMIILEDKFSNLKQLDISACVQLTDNALKSISLLENLETLLISANYFTTSGINHLISHKNLKTIKANQCPRLTNRTLEKFAIMESLERLHLHGCKRICPSALEYFKEVINPNLVLQY